MLLKRRCPVCDASSGEVIKRISINISKEMRSKINYPDYYDVVSCDRCGMVFADTDLSKEDVDSYYIECNAYDTASDVKRDIYDESCVMYYDAIKPYITDESLIIDVGCGNGRFLRYLKDKGFQRIYGLDPSESSIRRLEKNQINGFVGSIYDVVSEDLKEKFDVVVCSFVFEHLLCPDVCIKNLTSLIKKGGVLYIAVPNAEGFKDYLREVPNYFNQEHINYFTTNSLDYFCARNGLARISSKEECCHVMCPSSPEVVISAVYRRSGEMPSEDFREKYDECGRKSVRAYFEKIECKQNQQKDAVRELLREKEEVIVWGTGGMASFFMNEMPELLDKVICFVDNDNKKQNSTFFGKEVIGPNKLTNYSSATIMICIMMSRNSVVEQLQKMNLANEIFLLP